MPGSKLLVLGMVIPPLIGNPYNGYINPCYLVDDHPLLYGNNGSLDPGTLGYIQYHSSSSLDRSANRRNSHRYHPFWKTAEMGFSDLGINPSD